MYFIVGHWFRPEVCCGCTRSSSKSAIVWLSCCWPVRLNTPFICREKAVMHLGYYAVHCKHVCAFLKESNLFKRLTVMVDAQNVSVMLINCSVTKNMGSAIHVAVMTKSQLICHALYALTCISVRK
jgi:hypothetical protein